VNTKVNITKLAGHFNRLKGQLYETSNFSKDHMTHDSSGPATLAISVGLQHKILMHLESVLKFEASMQKTHWFQEIET